MLYVKLARTRASRVRMRAPVAYLFRKVGFNQAMTFFVGNIYLPLNPSLAPPPNIAETGQSEFFQPVTYSRRAWDESSGSTGLPS